MMERKTCCGSKRKRRKELQQSQRRCPRQPQHRGAQLLCQGLARTDSGQTDTHHKADILDFPNAHVDALPLVHRQADVDEVVFVSHAADLHEGKEVTVIVTAFRFQSLQKGHRTATRDIFGHVFDCLGSLSE